MRLGLSTLLICALASASLVACGDETGGSGGAGGAGGGATSGSGGDDTGSGTGGDDTGSGTGGDDTGSGTGGGDTQECTVELVEVDGACDAGCDGTFSSATAKMCTFGCGADAVCPESDEGTYECVTEVSSGESVCAYTCTGGDACPGGYICGDESVCIPDTVDG